MSEGNGAEGSGDKKGARRKGGWWFLAAMVILHLLVHWLSPDLGTASLARFLSTLKTLLPLFGVMFVLLWLFNLFVRPGRVAQRIGRASGVRGWVLAIGAGVLSMGPMYLWYPVLAGLRARGLRPALAAAFLYSRAVKIPMLPFMAHYFGAAYTALFVLCILAFSVVSGAAMDWTRGPETPSSR